MSHAYNFQFGIPNVPVEKNKKSSFGVISCRVRSWVASIVVMRSPSPSSPSLISKTPPSISLMAENTFPSRRPIISCSGCRQEASALKAILQAPPIRGVQKSNRHLRHPIPGSDKHDRIHRGKSIWQPMTLPMRYPRRSEHDILIWASRKSMSHQSFESRYLLL